MIYLLTDTETTGLKPEKSFILSNGSILYNSDTGETSEFYEELNWDELIPGFHIPEDTIKVHGITREHMLQNGINPYKSMSNFFHWIYDFCNKTQPDGKLDVIIAFNLPYDLNMFISNLKFLIYRASDVDQDLLTDTRNLFDYYFDKDYVVGEPTVEQLLSPLFIDSLIIDQIMHFDVDGEKVYHDLQTVGERYNIPEDPNAHNAIADTRRTFEVLKIQLKELEENNIDINQYLESRLIRKYKMNQDYWGKKDLDYLGREMGAAKYL